MLGSVAFTLWTGTGGTILGEEVGVAETGAGEALEIIEGAIAGAG